MSRPLFVRSRLAAIAPMAGSDFGFPILGAHQSLFKEFAGAIWPASHDGNAEPRVRSQETNLSLSHPASALYPLPGSHAAGRVPPAGRTIIRHSWSSCRRGRRLTATGSGSAPRTKFLTSRHVGLTLLKLGECGGRETVMAVCRAGRVAAPLSSNGDPK
jgi:hypothetical protein